MYNTSELINNRNLLNGTNYQFDSNRFSKPNTAIYFKNGSFQAPADIYFKSPFTVVVWVNFKIIRNYSRILDFGNGVFNDNVVLALFPGGKPSISIKNATIVNYNWVYGPSINANTWYHVTFVHQNGKASIYINGKKGSEGNMIPPNQVNRTKNYIAKSNWNTDPPTDGILSDLKIYDGALTDNEIATDYASMNQLPMMSCG